MQGRDEGGELRDILIRRANGEEFDMREWLAIRRVRFYENAEHAFAHSISQSAMQLPFVKRARVELQTSLGGRKGAGGVDVAGAFAEDDSGILGWQLRAYAAEHGAKGLNTGMFYRRVVGGALAGVNVFADYEDGDDGDFWRWSVGGDVKNRLGELSANRYFAITDAQVVGGQNTYTREGYDVDFAVRIPRLEWAKARVGYYEFKGEFGDEDENGFRAGLDLSPGAGLVVGVEYDDDDGKFGGNISYTRHFGETSRSAQRAGDFNPRAHFYDSARREYSQRISRASGGGGEVVNVNSAIDVGVFGSGVSAMIITAGSFALPATGIVTATTHATQNGNATLRQGWELVIGNNAQIEFRRGPTATLAVTGGSGTFNRNNANITLIQMGGADITLLGTRFDFEVNGGNVNITLREGGLGIPASGVNVQVADMMARVRSGEYIVGCGVGQTIMVAGAEAKCAIAGAMPHYLSPNVTLPAANNILLGRITLGAADSAVSVAVTPAGFFAMTNRQTQTIISVLLSSASAVAAIGEQSAVQLRASATLQGDGALQTPRGFVFIVSINRPPRQEMVTITSAAQNSAAGYTPTLTITQAMDITITSAAQLAQAGVVPTRTITAAVQSITVTSAEQLMALGVMPTLTINVHTLLVSGNMTDPLAGNIESRVGGFLLTLRVGQTARQLTTTLAISVLRHRTTHTHMTAYAPAPVSGFGFPLTSNARQALLFTLTTALPSTANVDDATTLASFAPTTTLGVFSPTITIGRYDPPIE